MKLNLGHFIRRLFSKRKRNYTPTWNTVQGGPIQGARLYLPEQQPAFREMLQGSYDSFFWEIINCADCESRTILDIGGHIGYHSLCFAKLCGTAGAVHVFEPNAANIERMKLIFAENERLAAPIQVHRCALSDFQGTTRFNLSDDVDNQTSSGGYLDGSSKPLPDEEYARANFRSVEVSVNTLDNFVRESNISDIHFMKIDVEGAESNVLRGGTETIAEHRPLILAEVHSITEMLNVSQILHALNYNIAVVDEDCASRCFIAAKPNAQTGRLGLVG